MQTLICGIIISKETKALENTKKEPELFYNRR